MLAETLYSAPPDVIDPKHEWTPVVKDDPENYSIGAEVARLVFLGSFVIGAAGAAMTLSGRARAAQGSFEASVLGCTTTQINQIRLKSINQASI